MSSDSKPVVVIVPGSFAMPSLYDAMTPFITKAGYDFVFAPLLSVNDGTVHPAPTMADDAAAIRAIVLDVLDSQHRNAVVLMHSYGGFPGSEALEGLHRSARGAGNTAVTGLLFMTSHLSVEGESCLDVMGDYFPPDMKPTTPGQYAAFPTPMAPMVFSDISDSAVIDKFSKAFSHHSLDTFAGKLSYAAWRDIPSIYISAGNDIIVPTAVQTMLVERAQREGAKLTKVFWEDVGHCPCVSVPEKVVEELVKVANF